jgi:hypothetical protein
MKINEIKGDTWYFGRYDGEPYWVMRIDNVIIVRRMHMRVEVIFVGRITEEIPKWLYDVDWEKDK